MAYQFGSNQYTVLSAKNKRISLMYIVETRIDSLRDTTQMRKPGMQSIDVPPGRENGLQELVYCPIQQLVNLLPLKLTLIIEQIIQQNALTFLSSITRNNFILFIIQPFNVFIINAKVYNLCTLIQVHKVHNLFNICNKSYNTKKLKNKQINTRHTYIIHIYTNIVSSFLLFLTFWSYFSFLLFGFFHLSDYKILKKMYIKHS